MKKFSLLPPIPWARIVYLPLLPLAVMLLSAWAHTDTVQLPPMGMPARMVSM